MPIGAEPQHEPQDHQDRLHLAQPPAAEEEFRSFAELTLREIDNRDLQQRMQIDNADSPTSLRRWSNAYLMMAREAMEMGIPASAIPPIPGSPTRQELLDARDHLNGMIASFQSANI